MVSSDQEDPEQGSAEALVITGADEDDRLLNKTDANPSAKDVASPDEAKSKACVCPIYS